MFGALIRSLSNSDAEGAAKQRALHQAEETRRWSVFMEYHHNSSWAQAKASNGGWLSDEAVSYMEAEIVARKERDSYFAKLMEKENGQRGTESDAAAVAADGFPGSDRIPGSAESEAAHSQDGAGAGPDTHAQADR